MLADWLEKKRRGSSGPCVRVSGASVRWLRKECSGEEQTASKGQGEQEGTQIKFHTGKTPEREKRKRKEKLSQLRIPA